MPFYSGTHARHVHETTVEISDLDEKINDIEARLAEDDDDLDDGTRRDLEKRLSYLRNRRNTLIASL